MNEERPITEEEWGVARRLWPNDETMDFVIATSKAADDTIWTTLRCSAHGMVQASVEWDLEMLNVAAGSHYVRKHLRPARLQHATGSSASS